MPYKSKAKAKARTLKYYLANRERMLKAHAKYQRSPRGRERYRISYIKGRYGLSEADYYAMIGRQKGKCAICKKKGAGDRDKRRLSVDHCRRTGKVRGLLCGMCNRSLGGFRDSLRLLTSAINYLKKKRRKG